MPRGRPINEETRARILELARGGMGRNAIAREVGVAGATVTAVTDPEGIVFDWSTTDLATAARRVQADAMRLDLAHAAMVRAGEMLEAMSAPTLRIDFSPGGKKRAARYHEHVMDTPTISDIRNLATTFAVLTQRAADLIARPIGGAGATEASSILDGLGVALQTVAAAMGGAEDDPTAEPVITGRDEMIVALEAQLRAEGGDPEGGDDVDEG